MPKIKRDENGDYYNSVQEEAIVKFLTAETGVEKEKIYNEFLMEPINVMIEFIITRYRLHRKFYNFKDLHTDALGFLATKFAKFDPQKGTKSYSYFGTICKNYLYNEMMKDYKRTVTFTPFNETDNELLSRDDLVYRIDDIPVDLNGFIMELNKTITEELKNENLSENELKIGQALTQILGDWLTLFNDNTNGKNSTKFNKNLILLYIRNLTGLNTKEIRNGMKTFKSIYSLFKKGYFEKE